MGDCFSPQGLILITAVATALSGAFAVLYRDGMKSRDSHIEDLIQQRDDLLAEVLKGRRVAAEVAQAARHAASRRRGD